MNKKSHKGATQMNLYIRILAGGYLIYLAYDIFRMRDVQAKNFWLMMLFCVFFVIFGAVLAVLSIKDLIQKNYYDPNNDVIEEENREEHAENTTTEDVAAENINVIEEKEQDTEDEDVNE